MTPADSRERHPHRIAGLDAVADSGSTLGCDPRTVLVGPFYIRHLLAALSPQCSNDVAAVAPLP